MRFCLHYKMFVFIVGNLFSSAENTSFTIADRAEFFLNRIPCSFRVMMSSVSYVYVVDSIQVKTPKLLKGQLCYKFADDDYYDLVKY